MVRDAPAEPAPSHKTDTPRNEPPPYPAEKARGGEIILRTRTQRTIFIAGLAGAVVLALILKLLAWW